MSDFIAHVIAELDMSKAEAKMSAFTNKKHTVDVDVNLVSKNGNINNYLNQIKSQFGQAGNSAGTNFANSVNSSLGKINVKNAASQIANLQRTLKSMNFSSSSIDTITRDLQEMELAVTKVTTRMNGQNLNVRVDGIDQMGRAVSVVKEFDSVTGKMQRTSETVATSLKQMFTSVDASKLNADISALDANFVKLKGSVNNESTALAKLKTDLANIGNISGLDRQQAEFERITQEVNRLSIAYKEAYAENQALVSSQQLMAKKTILGNQIQTWMNSNTKAAKIYRTEIEQLNRDLSNVGNTSQLKAVSNAFTELKTTATAAGNAGKTTLGILVSNMTKLSPLFGMGAMITTSMRAVNSMIDSVIKLDTALIDLQKTTTMTNSELESFYSSSNDVAIQMGVSTEEIISQAAAWSRLGYSSAEAATAMAKLSSQFAAISPGMNTDAATDGLVSIMKAYNIDVNNVLDGIMSKINIIGNTAATSNADIVEMLTRSSSAMAEANNTLDQTIALETAAVEITQDAASVGTAYKTLAMRIRGYDEETEGFTNDVEVLSGKVADLTKTAKTPGGISLFTDETKTEYKSTYQLLKEISQIYDDLTDKDQAELLEVLAGKRQGQVVAATIKNFSAAEEALNNMAKSAGSADKEMSVIMDSMEYKLNALKETGVGIAQNLFQRNDMKLVVDVLTEFLGIIDKVTEKLGLFGTIGLGTGITLLVKNFSLLRDVTSSAVGEALKSVSNLTATINGATGLLNPSSLQSYTAALDGLNLSQAKVVLSTTNLNAAQQAQVLVNAGLMASESSITAVLATEAMEKAGLSTETAALIASKAGLTTATATCTAAEFEEILATQGIVGADAKAIMANMGLTTSNYATGFSFTALGAAAKSAAASIAAFFLTNPVGWAIMAAAAIAGTIKLVDALTESFDEAVEKAEESRSAYQNTSEELQSLQNELDTTKAKIDELQGKDSLTVVEEGELAKLQQQNSMLEAQIAIKERLAQTQATTAAEDANNVLTKKTIETTGVDEYGNVAYSTSNIIEKTTAKQKELNSAREEYNKILEDYKTLSQKHSQDKEDHGGWFETTQWEKDEKQLKSYESQLKNYENQINNLDSEIANNLSTISENAQMLYDENGNIREGYVETANAVNDLYNYTLYADTATQDMAADTAEASNAIVDYSNRISDLSTTLEEFKTMQSNIQSAMDDSKSATGLTAEEITNLESAYASLSGYDPSKLFEQTANGVHLNSQELARLNEQLETQKLEEYAQTINDIQKSIYSERAKGNDTSALEQELQQAKLLKSEYEGLVSAYNKWITAKSGGKERDSYESVGQGYEDMQDILNQGWYGDESLNAYLDLLLSAEQRTGDAVADFEKLNKTIEGTSHSLLDYWKYDDDNNLVTDGLFDFLDDVNAKLGDSFAKVNEDGLYEFDFDGDKLQQVADAFGTSTEMVELFERAMIDAGMAVDMSDKSIVDQINDIRDSLKELQKAGEISDSINLDFDVDKDPIEDVRSTIESLKSERVKIDAETNPEAAKELDELIAKCEQQYYFRLNAETDGSLDRAVTIVEQLKSLTAAPLSVEARVANTGRIQQLAEELAALPPEVQIAVGISAENVGSVDAIVNQLNTQPSSIQVPVNYEKGSEPESVDDAKGIANYELGESPKTVPDASGVANFKLGSYPTILPSVYQNVIANKIGFASGTAHADGTVNAYARAKDWALSKDENALVNELGTESIVRNGKWIPIPGNTHIESLKKGDIIFSAEQTKELIRTGKVTSGGGHGKVALADGTAWASAYESGSGGGRRKSTSSTTSLSSKSTASENSSYSSPSKSSGSSSSKSSSSSSNSEEEFEETFDLVEIALKRIGEAIDRLKIKAESAFKSLSKRNNAAADEISMITEEINLQNSAYERYMQQANSVGLSSDWVEKIKNGSIDISTVTDEDLADKIKEFQDFYDKAIECKDAVAGLHEEIAQLYADRFNNIQTDFEHQLSLVEHLTNTYNTGLDILEAKGLKGSKTYYQALQKAEKENQEILAQKLVDLTEAFNQAMDSGEIEKGSEQWYEMQESINSVKEAIDESTLSLIEFEKAMRELDWEYFDFMQDRISALNDEADFLIDLMSNEDMFDDKGNMTDAGLTVAGLHGQKYNTYMAQADEYASEIEKLNEQIAEDPYNTDLIERREELLELQREAILAAEDEKQALKDLVEEGIKTELDALKDLIDAYNDSLDSAKDLYNYQKKVKKQTEEIASLQKQLSAYSGDTSEEARATIQKIEVDLSKAMEELQETEYEQYISDQKKLLDELYLEYETILNSRLDDVDALISDMIDTINANSSTIGDIISQECENVGYTLTESMNAIWSNEGGATAIISKYGDKFMEQNISTLNAILGIKAYTDSLIEKANAEAAAKEEETKKETEVSKPSSTPSTPQTSPSTSKGTQGDGQIQVGDKVTFVSGKYYSSSDGSSPTGSKYQGKQVYVTKINNASWATKPYHISTGNKLGSGDLGWLTKSQISGYAKGLKYATKDEDAWVNELAPESIISPSKRAIITHVDKTDRILNDSATKNIWDMADNPAAFISKHLNGNQIIAGTSSIGGCTFGDINIPIEHVQDYNDLVAQMQRDHQFEKMIQQMTIAKVKNNNRFQKNVYSWN